MSVVCSFGDHRLPDAFWERVTPCPMSGCWLWLGHMINKNKRSGYATPGYCVNRKMVSARRLAYVTLVQSVEPSARISATCSVDVCCNPAHAMTARTGEVLKKYRADFVREWNRSNKPKLRRGYLKYKYDLTDEDVARKRAEQDNRCEICRVVFDASPSSPVNIDHCHTSNAVRGLLCPTCNVGLGNFHDRPDLLSRAISYLAKHNVEAEGE